MGMIFKAIIIIYCLVGLTLNLVFLPKRNKQLYEDSKRIMQIYDKLDDTLDRVQDYLDREDKP